MESNRHQELSFFKIFRPLFLLFALDFPTATQTHPPQPDLEVPGTAAAAAAIAITTDPGENRRSNSRSTPRSLTELLIPATICTGIFSSISHHVHDRQDEYPLYAPLVASIFFGTLMSFLAIFLALRRSQPAAIEAETVELNEEEIQRMEKWKEALLKIGFIFSLLAFLLLMMLQLSRTSLGPLAIMFFAGSVVTAVGLHFFIGFQLR